MQLLPPFTSKSVCGKKCQTDTGPMQQAPVCTPLIKFYVSGEAYISFGFTLTDVRFCTLCNTSPQKHYNCMRKRRNFFFTDMGIDVCVMKNNYSTILLSWRSPSFLLVFLFLLPLLLLHTLSRFYKVATWQCLPALCPQCDTPSTYLQYRRLHNVTTATNVMASLVCKGLADVGFLPCLIAPFEGQEISSSH